MQTRKLTKYHIHTGRLTRPVDFAVVSDLHDEPYDDLWPLLDGADALLVPGEGVMPLGRVLRDIRAAGYDGAATLELVTHYIDAPSRYARLALERAKELMV